MTIPGIGGVWSCCPIEGIVPKLVLKGELSGCRIRLNQNSSTMEITKAAIGRRDFLACAAKTAAAMALLPPGTWDFREQLKRRGPPKKIIIIGAGLAGLSAGFELTQAGHEVTILEAQTHAGGRAFSIRQPFSDNLYAEAGATGIAETNDLTLKYAHLFGLELDSWDPPRELQDILYIRGRLVRRDAWH